MTGLAGHNFLGKREVGDSNSSPPRPNNWRDMNNTRYYNIANKVRKCNGPGGLHCNCCNPYRCHPRNMKHLVRRTVRRKLKRELRKVED